MPREFVTRAGQAVTYDDIYDPAGRLIGYAYCDPYSGDWRAWCSEWNLTNVEHEQENQY